MRRSPLLLALLLLAASPALAQITRPRFELTPVAGYRLSGEIDSDEFVSSDVEIDESAVLGVELGIPLSPGFQLELLLRHQQSALVVDPGVLEPSQELGDVTLTHAHAGLLFEWGPGQVVGFVVVSGGLAAIDPEAREVDAETRLSGSLGGGLKLYFNRNLGLRFEGRGFWTDFESELDDDDRRRRRANDALVQGEGSVGLIFAF